jgi:hypothetical protein
VASGSERIGAHMPRRSLSQKSFFDPEFVCPGCLEAGTVPWLLGRYRSLLFPARLFRGWRGETQQGRAAWPAVVLMTLVLLRWSEEGMGRRASCRRARKDAEWRAALGLQMDAPTPTEKTVREFERFLRERDPKTGARRYELFHEHVVAQCEANGVVGKEAVWATDSTPMLCYGATLGTVRLLGDGLRSLARDWRRAAGGTLEELEARWKLPLLTTKSTKAAFRIDWKNPEARSKVVAELADAVVRVVEDVRFRFNEVRRNKRKGLLRRCRGLLKVVADDLERDEAGRLVVARRVQADRHVSVTDPQARHGRKSKSKRFNGFKLHVLGDVVSGVIASLAVTPGDAHDSRPAPRVIRRAKALFTDIRQVLGDTAYGAAELRVEVRRLEGVQLMAPPPAAHGRATDKLTKNEFDIDFRSMTAVCPNGQESAEALPAVYSTSGETRSTTRLYWEREQCSGCPLAERCPTTTRGGRGRHSILLHPEEEEVRAARREWDDPSVRDAYRTRSQCERLVHKLTRRGGRQARQWGLAAARQQAHVIAASANLLLLARALASKEAEERQARTRRAA